VSARLLLTLVVGPAAGLAAQYPRLADRVPAPLAAVVVPLLDSARAAGLPTELLEAKVLEGVTKHAGPERIAAALRRLAGELLVARRALGVGSSARELAAGAGALRAGLGPADLERVRRAEGGRDAAVALEIATDLIARAVPPDTASAVLVRALTARVSDAELERLRLAVERDVAQGVPASVAASLRSRPFPSGGRP
jgi:hypothetical protein